MRRIIFTLLGILALILGIMIFSRENSSNNEKVKPLVIAHRGAQSILPEHTLEAYKKAIELGADFIEPDLVMTKDGFLVARHEPFISGTTNVSELVEYAHLKSTKILDGKEITDWFVSDFTLKQIKTLRAKQSRADRSNEYDGLFEIPTLQEIIVLAKANSAKSGNKVGIYPEMKHPYFHNQLGLKIEDTLLEVLEKAGWSTKEAPVYIQCFEVAPLKYLRSKSSVKLIQLVSASSINDDGSLNFLTSDGDFISDSMPFDFYMNGDKRTYDFFATEEGMKFVSSYANGLGPWKPFIISYKKKEDEYFLMPPTNFVELAHKYNLEVHPYTFRNEDKQWSSANPRAEYHLFFDAGVDGIFSDYTNEAVQAVSTWKK